MNTTLTADWLMDPDTQAVCTLLTDAGYNAWFVGGCVRDALMSRDSADIDITTNARPEAVIELAANAGVKSVPTGIDHGTVTLVAGGKPFEITTLREDVSTDGRRATVAFSDDIAVDAARRDLTMNALYALPDGTVVDPLGGLDDLRARRVRFIGDPEERIAEDYLRILRFFRFYAQCGDPEGGIDPEGLAACAAGLDGLDHVSAERIGAEMRKLLDVADPAPALAAMRASGVLMRLMPGAGTGLLTVLIHVEEAARLAPSWLRRLAALGGEDVADTLRLSKADAGQLTRLVSGLHATSTAGELGYREGAETAIDILALRAAAFEREMTEAEQAEAHFGAEQVFPLKAKDLMPEFQGPLLGAKLADLQRRWIDSGFTQSKDELIAAAGELGG